jgi:hypothetical protein
MLVRHRLSGLKPPVSAWTMSEPSDLEQEEPERLGQQRAQTAGIHHLAPGHDHAHRRNLARAPDALRSGAIRSRAGALGGWMNSEETSPDLAYRAVLLAAGLLLFGLCSGQLVTLMLAVLFTVHHRHPAGRRGHKPGASRHPRPIGALTALLGAAAVVALVTPC